MEDEHQSKVTLPSLDKWGIQGKVQELSSTGLSGAGVHKIDTDKGSFILKGYPEKYPPEHIRFVHKILKHLEKRGYPYTPRVVSLKDSTETTCTQAGIIWEITSYKSGEPAPQSLTQEQAQALGETIATMHQMLEDFQTDEDTRFDKPKNTDVLHDKITGLKNLTETQIEVLQQRDAVEEVNEFLDTTKRLLKMRLDTVAWDELEKSVPKQVIHQDLHADHVLFEQNQITGIIDFGEAKYANRLEDLARVIGSFTDGHEETALAFIEGYQKVIPLNEAEQQLLTPLVLHAQILAILRTIEHASKTPVKIEQHNEFKKKIKSRTTFLNAFLHD